VKKTVSIFLLFFYVTAQCFLPKGNFAYIEQIPGLYADFCKANDTKDVFEFLEEQFFELGFDEGDEDEPYEREAKPVPFQAPSVQTFVAFTETIETEFLPTQEKNAHNFTYVLKEHWVHASAIYHPPKNKLV
jgi:hypothetical protein